MTFAGQNFKYLLHNHNSLFLRNIIMFLFVYLYIDIWLKDNILNRRGVINKKLTLFGRL